MSTILFKNAHIINRSEIFQGDLLVKDDLIEKIDTSIDVVADEEIDCTGKYLMPGIIDDQVHFREPGLTHKANIATESRAAAAGGVTSFMEMPNTKPPAVTQEELQKKYDIAEATACVNYSFYMGASNDNIEEVLKTNYRDVCGVKIFMGSSTGNMLVDNKKTLENLYSKINMLIACHCEDESTIRANLELARAKFGDDIPMQYHPIIRNTEGCYLSSSMAVELAKKHNTRLHVLHISTADEIALFNNDIPLEEKRITSEVCVHHLYFDDSYYDTLGSKVKCNPAIKTAADRKAILEGLKNGYFDVIATDHAPHTAEEKAKGYMQAPSGLPLVQHSLNMMMEFYHSGDLSMEFIVDKMCHSPAVLFGVEKRGFLDEGNYADIVLFDLDNPWTVSNESVHYKCGWTPLEGFKFKSRIDSTLCNGNWVYKNGNLTGVKSGRRLLFTRN